MSMQSNVSGRAALAETLLPEGAARIISAILLVIAGTMVLAISAKIKVPFYPVPMTLQTLAVPLIAAAYGSRLGVITILAYLAEGALGLPVFTNTPPAVAGPGLFPRTDGRLSRRLHRRRLDRRRGCRPRLGQLLPEAFRSDAPRRRRDLRLRLRLARLVRDAVERGDRPRHGAAFTGGVAPFLLGDLLKIILAAAAVPAVWRLTERWA